MTTPTVRCPSCGTLNRVPAGRAGEKARCGQCRAEFTVPPIYSAPVDVTDSSFGPEVRESELPVLVFFWSPGCGHCVSMEPAVRELSGVLSGRLKVARVNVTVNPSTASYFEVTGTPTFVLMKGGREAARFAGAMPREELARRLAPYI